MEEERGRRRRRGEYSSSNQTKQQTRWTDGQKWEE
jgi:hypothetical protein